MNQDSLRKNPVVEKRTPARGSVSLACERLVSVTELAEQWDVDRHTVVRLLDEAGVKAIYLSVKAYGTRRYAESDIDEFLRSRQANARPLASGHVTRRRPGVRRILDAAQADETPHTPPVPQESEPRSGDGISPGSSPSE